MSAHCMQKSVWGKVYKAELFTNLRFPEGYWYEDSIFAQIVWPLTKKAAVSDKDSEGMAEKASEKSRFR